MGWLRFRRSIKILPGVRLNIGKRGLSSVSVGRRGAHVTVGKSGVRKTIGVPGTGLSYSTLQKPTTRELLANLTESSTGWRLSKPLKAAMLMMLLAVIAAVAVAILLGVKAALR